MAALLSLKEQSRIWQVQRQLGLTAARLAHVKKTVEFLGKIRGGKLGAFYSALLPQNRRYEDRSAYLARIKWVQEKHSALSPDEQTDLEAGLRLHDIGYAVGADADHPEKGYQLLHKHNGIWPQLRLAPVRDRQQIEFVVRYHGYFNDIGYLYRAEALKLFSGAEKAALVMAGALDSCAKPVNDKFHSVLFSRVLDRYARFLEQDTELTEQERLRQLFGPCNYVWLEAGDLTALDKHIDQMGLRATLGYRRLIENSYFMCWALLKDLVTPKIGISSTYYTPVNRKYLPQLVNLLALLGQIAECSTGAGELVFSTNFIYGDLTARQPKIDLLRKELSSPPGELWQETDEVFTNGNRLYFRRVKVSDAQVKVGIGLR